jgi:predicted alpha-1,2-mannosidase
MVAGFLSAYDESGWLPQWPSPGTRQAMVGSHADNILADAIVKKLPGVNATAAYAAIRKDAFDAPPRGGAEGGRACLPAYIDLGYIPSDAGCSESVARSLNYYHSDAAIAGAAAAVGAADDAAALRARARRYAELFEPATGFFRARDAAGAWVEPFDQYRWGSPYTEGGPWQFRFEVPHDARGLAALYAAAGHDMCGALEAANTGPSTFHVGRYGSTIHEMTEMAALCWGQFSLNNQPSFAMNYMGIAAQASVTAPCAARGQFWLRKAARELFVPGPDMYVGDEDNGSMGAWFLLTAMGLYSLEQGSTAYVLGAPLFANVTVAVRGRAATHLTVLAANQAPDHPFVQAVTWRGQPVAGVTVDYADLMQGGVLEFTMGPQPAQAPAAAPAAAAADDADDADGAPSPTASPAPAASRKVKKPKKSATAAPFPPPSASAARPSPSPSAPRPSAAPATPSRAAAALPSATRSRSRSRSRPPVPSKAPKARSPPPPRPAAAAAAASTLPSPSPSRAKRAVLHGGGGGLRGGGGGA